MIYFIETIEQLRSLPAFELVRYFGLTLEGKENWLETLKVNISGVDQKATAQQIDELAKQFLDRINLLTDQQPGVFGEVSKPSRLCYANEPFVKLMPGPYAFDFLDNPDLSLFKCVNPSTNRLIKCDWSTIELEAVLMAKKNGNLQPDSGCHEFMEIQSNRFKYGIVKVIKPRIYFDYVLAIGPHPVSASIRS